MNFEPLLAKRSVERGDASYSEENHANRVLRAVLLLSFGGLLVLLLYSGANALRTLNRLHEAEETARSKPLERRRVLTTVVLSANAYSNGVEEFLLSFNAAGGADDGEVQKRAEDARAALQAYPAERGPKSKH